LNVNDNLFGCWKWDIDICVHLGLSFSKDKLVFVLILVEAPMHTIIVGFKYKNYVSLSSHVCPSCIFFTLGL